MLLYYSVNVKTLYEHGKEYPWDKPKRCPNCNGIRVWWHSYAQRSFSGFRNKLWVRKCICADCEAVHTMRPFTHWKGFQYSSFVILRSLLEKITHDRWRCCVVRQNQQYWFHGLRFQSSKHSNTKYPTEEILRKLISMSIIVASHSMDCEILRL